LREAKEELKQGTHPASINNQTATDGSVIKSEVCFKRHASIPDPKDKNSTKEELLK
jgi:hypothetical protein